MDPFALSTRSERQTLLAWSGGELALKPLLSAEAHRAAWRIGRDFNQQPPILGDLAFELDAIPGNHCGHPLCLLHLPVL